MSATSGGTTMLDPHGTRPPTRDEIESAMSRLSAAINPLDILATNLSRATGGDGEVKAISAADFGELALMTMAARSEAAIIIGYCEEILDDAKTLTLAASAESRQELES